MSEANINVNEIVTEEPEVTETSVVDEVPETTETVTDEPTEEVVEEEVEESEVEPVQPPKDYVPLKTLLEEKKKRQDNEKKIREYEQILTQQENERKKLEAAQQYMDRGYPEMEAVLLAKKDIETKAEIERLSAKVFDREVQGDIRDLAKSNDFYSDAEAFADEIKEKMKAMSISAKDAYMLLRGETRTYEMRQKQEQISAVKRKQVITKRPATASPSAPSNPYKLDESDRKALAELKRAQPDAGWDTAKYFKLMKT